MYARIFFVYLNLLILLTGNDVESLTTLAPAVTRFGFNLLGQLYNTTPRVNIMISPFAISTGFAMIEVGAKGATKTEMMNVLQYTPIPLPIEAIVPDITLKSQYNQAITMINGLPGPDNIINLVNQVLVTKSVTLAFQYQNDVTNFAASVNSINFNGNTNAIVQSVNANIGKKTSGKINNLLSVSDIPNNSSVVGLDAIYYKGKWGIQFDTSMTQTETFTGLDSQGVDMLYNAQFVTMTNLMLNYASLTAQNMNFNIFEIPFTSTNPLNKASMYFFLPKANGALDSFILNNPTLVNDLENAISSLNQTLIAQLSIPKFSFSSNYDLTSYMKQLGMVKVFDPANADLSGIQFAVNPALAPNLVLNKVIHEAYLEIDDGEYPSGFVIDSKGSASAASGTTSNITLIANQPFLFMVRHVNKIILFLGVVNSVGTPSTRNSSPGKK